MKQTGELGVGIHRNNKARCKEGPPCADARTLCVIQSRISLSLSQVHWAEQLLAAPQSLWDSETNVSAFASDPLLLK